LRRPTGGRCIPPRLQARLRGDREQAAWLTLSVGAVARLAEDEESERAGRETGSRRGLGQKPMAVTGGTQVSAHAGWRRTHLRDKYSNFVKAMDALASVSRCKRLICQSYPLTLH